MLYDKRYRPEVCASSDEAREVLANVHFDAQKRCMVATDGHVLVKVPVDCVDDHDTTGPIPVAALKAANKHGGKREPLATMHANGSVMLASGVTMPRPEDIVFPDWERVIPTDFGQQSVTFTINADLLARIQKALGSNGVTLTVRVDGDGMAPILVKPNDAISKADGALGVLMPMRT